MDSENQPRGPLGKKALSVRSNSGADKTPRDRKSKRKSAGNVRHSPAPSIPPEAKRFENWTITVCPTGPFRRPDYRWRSAQLLLEGEEIPPEWVDDWIRLAVRLLKLDRGDLNLLPSGQLAHAATARRLAEHGPEWDKVEVEARLLAGESTVAIGNRLGLAAEVLEIYEKFYFAVTDSLKARSWIVYHAIRIHEDIAYHDLGVHLRHIGYFGGPIAVSGYLDAFRPEGGREYFFDLPPDQLEEGRRVARIDIGLRMTRVTTKNFRRWMKMDLLMTELGVYELGMGQKRSQGAARFRALPKSMARDKRGYLYRSRRVKGRVVKDYFGRGPIADNVEYLLEKSRSDSRASDRATTDFRAAEAPRKPFSLDLRERVLADYQAGLSFAQLGRKYTISAEWVRQFIRRYQATGELAPRLPPIKLTFQRRHEAQLRAAVAEQPDLTLKELRAYLGLEVSISTLWNALRELKISFKKKPLVAAEQQRPDVAA